MKKLINYLQAVRAEMSKVSWPPREQWVESTGITLMLTVILALFIFGIDKVIMALIQVIL